MTPSPDQRQPSPEELLRIASGGTVDSEVMAWLEANDPDGDLMRLAKENADLPSLDEEITIASDSVLIPRAPNPAEMQKLAEGRQVDPAVEKWLREEDDGSIQAEINQLRSDAGFLDELAAVHKEQYTSGKSMLDAPAPDGYEVLREIDRGAQGAVYLARQIAAKRDVALKVLLQGSFATERQQMRFEREVEVVASLKHPSIVTLYDSGLTDEGNAYLAMEFIDGSPLNAFEFRTNEGRTRTPTLKEKIGLIIQVCDAVGYAHQRGIIHRDLKPANILVDHDGKPHILDFGLAKAVGTDNMTESQYEMTAAGEFMGTFAYASPEQVSGDPDLVDTRTDVYALGVLTYEMILGKRPYRVTGSIAQMVKAITDEPPVPPRSEDPTVDMDLETILLRSLDKDSDRRYQSPGALAADLKHWLKGEAIEARRDDAWYVARKFLRRHWLPVSGIAAGVMVLAAFAVFMTVLWERADHFNRTSDQMLVSATDLLANMDTGNPDQPMSAQTRLEVMQRWSEIITENLVEFPDLSAELSRDLADNFISLKEFEEAITVIDNALASYEERGQADSVGANIMIMTRGRLHFHNENRADSLTDYEQAFNALRKALGPRHVDTLEAQQGYGTLLMNSGDKELGIEMLSDASRQFAHRLRTPEERKIRKKLESMHANVLNSLGVYQLDQQPAWALPRLQQALKLVSNSDVEDRDWRRGSILLSIGKAQLKLHDLEASRISLEKSQRIKEDMKASARSVATLNVSLAELCLREGRLEESRKLAKAAREERLSRLDATDPLVIDLDILLAEIEIRSGNVQKATRLIETLQSVFEESSSPRDPIIMNRLLGLLAIQQDDLAEAEEQLLQAWKEVQRQQLEDQEIARTLSRDLEALMRLLGKDRVAEIYRKQAQPPPPASMELN